jgi:hypothetical protein
MNIEHRRRMLQAIERSRTSTVAVWGAGNEAVLTEFARRYYEQFGAALERAGLDLTTTWFTSAEVLGNAAMVMRVALQTQSPYWIDTPMVDLLEVATLDCPEYELHPNDLLTPDGLVIFDRPLVLVNDDGRDTAPIMGLAWVSDVEGIVWTPLMSSLDGVLMPMLLTGWDGWQFGSARATLFDDDSIDSGATLKLLPAFLRLIREHVVIRSHERLDRHTARRLQRSGLPLTEIVWVTLRRRQTAESIEEGGGGDWSHRWMVRGHWRNQWYPSEQRHAPRYISAHIKGPESAPLIIKQRRYEVIR